MLPHSGSARHGTGPDAPPKLADESASLAAVKTAATDCKVSSLDPAVRQGAGYLDDFHVFVFRFHLFVFLYGYGLLICAPH